MWERLGLSWSSRLGGTLRDQLGAIVIVLRAFRCVRGIEMADEKKLSLGEIRRTIATALGVAFGLVIGLLWNNVVLAGLKVLKIDLNATSFTVTSWAWLVVTAVVITVVMVVMIIIVSRWGNKQ